MDKQLHRRLTILGRIENRRSNQCDREVKRLLANHNIFDAPEITKLTTQRDIAKGKAQAYAEAAKMVAQVENEHAT